MTNIFIKKLKFFWKTAKIIVALNNLPYGVSNVPSLMKVRQQYLGTYMAFHDLAEINSSETEQTFTQTCLDRLTENLLVGMFTSIL